MRLLWEDRAWKEYLYWQAQDKKILKRIIPSATTGAVVHLRQKMRSRASRFEIY